MTDGPDPAHPPAADRPSARPGRTAYPMPEMRRLDVPGPAGPIDTLFYRLPGRCRRRGPADHCPRARRPARRLGPGPACRGPPPRCRGYRVVRPNIRGSYTYGRDWIGRSSATGAASMRPTATPRLDHLVELGLADPERLGVLRHSATAASWSTGWSAPATASRPPCRRTASPNEVAAWAQLRHRRPSTTARRCLGDPLSAGGHRQAVAAVAAAPRGRLSARRC